ncbi:tetratricopeptide repeat protein [Streptomyces sp. NPDC057438]|uniref:tetratricopeptide repeat protein n=1 Tax=Streptomyces sp. NPDC057438 TaxID=3346133 RepID=UPI00367868D6
MPGHVDLFEEHGEVAALWPQSPYHRRTVVCFDRHLDLKPLAPGGEEALRAAAHEGTSPAELLRRLPVRGVPGAFGLDDFWSAAALAAGLTDLVWVPSWTSYEGWESRAVNCVSLIATGGAPADPQAGHCCLAVTLCGVRLSVVPPDLLTRHLDRHVTGDVVTDIDLDWLVDEHGAPDHSVDDLADLVAACGCELSAMTWSTRSGFLPAEFRRVGPDVAGRLGLRARESSFLPSAPWPDDLMLRVHQGAGPWALDEPAAGSDESGAASPAAGVAVALRGLANASASPAQAQACYERAAAQGYRSSWLAYKIGAAHYAHGDHRVARDRLREAIALDPRDTLAMHARILSARATLRLDGPGAALAEFRSVAEELPLRAGVWRTVQVLADAQGDLDSAQTARDRLDLIERLTRARTTERSTGWGER